MPVDPTSTGCEQPLDSIRQLRDGSLFAFDNLQQFPLNLGERVLDRLPLEVGEIVAGQFQQRRPAFGDDLIDL